MPTFEMKFNKSGNLSWKDTGARLRESFERCDFFHDEKGLWFTVETRMRKAELEEFIKNLFGKVLTDIKEYTMEHRNCRNCGMATEECEC